MSVYSIKRSKRLQPIITYLEVVLGGLKSSVGDLAVVNDDGVALGAALLIGPAEALGELSIGVGKEEL